MITNILNISFLLFSLLSFEQNNIKKVDSLSSENSSFLVTLNEEESSKLLNYSKEDFFGIQVEEINELTIDITNSIKDKKISKSNFKRIFDISVNENSTNVSALLKNEKINSVSINSNVKVLGFNDESVAKSNYSYNYVENYDVYQDIEIYDSWEIEDGKSSTLVGVLDSGILGLNPFLVNNISDLSRDFSQEYSDDNYNDSYENALEDTDGHGTKVAGIIAANPCNGYYFEGVSPDVSLVSLKVGINGGVNSNTQINSIVRAISYAESIDIDVINMSITVFDNFISDPESEFGYINCMEVLKTAIENYSGIIVCASGNDYLNIDLENNYVYPACLNLDNVITVGAVDSNGNIWTEPAPINPFAFNPEITPENQIGSNYGEISVDLFAPGQNLITTSLESPYIQTLNCTATSFATPLVTGTVALLISHFPNLSNLQIKNLLLNNVEQKNALSNYCVSNGILNVYNIFDSQITYSWKNLSSHVRICSCGETLVQPHVVSSGSTCDLCNGNASSGFIPIP